MRQDHLNTYFCHKRGLSQAGSSTGGATSRQTLLTAAAVSSNAALAPPMLAAGAEFRCPSSDKNGPAFFKSRPVGSDFPTLVGDPLKAAVVTAVKLWHGYMDSPEGKLVKSQRKRAQRPPTDVDSARRGKQRREDPNQLQVDRGVRTSRLHAIYSGYPLWRHAQQSVTLHSHIAHDTNCTEREETDPHNRA